MKNIVKRSLYFNNKTPGMNSNINNCKNRNSNDDKFVIEDFQNQDQGEEVINDLVVKMDKSKRIIISSPLRKNL